MRAHPLLLVVLLAACVDPLGPSGGPFMQATGGVNDLASPAGSVWGVDHQRVWLMQNGSGLEHGFSLDLQASTRMEAFSRGSYPVISHRAAPAAGAFRGRLTLHNGSRSVLYTVSGGTLTIRDVGRTTVEGLYQIDFLPDDGGPPVHLWGSFQARPAT
jgi:hypothetical protein